MKNDKRIYNESSLTVKEIISSRRKTKPVIHTYGRYGSLAKLYLESHDIGRLWALAGNLPEYLHGIDRQAADLYEIMHNKLSNIEQFQKTGEYLSDLRKETEIQKLIDEEILNKLVYIKGEIL